MIIKRIPTGRLASYAKLLWASDDSDAAVVSQKERMIPTGSMHVVLRLSDHPIKIYHSPEDREGETFRYGVIAGIRSRYYIKDAPGPVRNVGALLQPGVAPALFGVAGEELAERHTAMEDIWGTSVYGLLERLYESGTTEQQLHLFESFLETRIPACKQIHPAVGYALSLLPALPNIGDVAKQTGYSHKHFIHLFRSAVGLSPVSYLRMLRLQRALELLVQPEHSLIDIALHAEYSDQAHFNREFREFAGISPGEYRKLRTEKHHVPLIGR